MKQIAFRAWRESHSPYSCADAYSYAVQCARRMPYEVRMYQVGAEMFACGEMRAAHACMPPQRACCWCTLACNLGYKVTVQLTRMVADREGCLDMRG